MQSQKKYLKEIREKYNWWKKENETLKGPTIKELNEDSDILKKKSKAF